MERNFLEYVENKVIVLQDVDRGSQGTASTAATSSSSSADEAAFGVNVNQNKRKQRVDTVFVDDVLE